MKSPWLGITLWSVCTALLAVGCGENNTDSDESSDASIQDAAMDASTVDAGPEKAPDAADTAAPEAGADADASMMDEPDAQLSCVPFGGCEDIPVGGPYECGFVFDGCNGVLDCDPDRTACTYPDFCGGADSTNTCGCTRASCRQREAECGRVDNCGEELNCGSCTGARDVCDRNRCVCRPDPAACGTRVCGMVENGCGEMVSCGTCPAGGGCTPDGQCLCPDSLCQPGDCGVVAIAGCRDECDDCAAKPTCGAGTGTCPGDCECGDGQVCNDGSCCVPEPVQCGDRCGVLVNNCGEPVECGGCPGAEVCEQGQCVNQTIADLVGRYVVRTHSFRRGGTPAINFLNRAEAISIVEISADGAGNVTLLDVGCVATTQADPDDLVAGGTVSVASRYYNLPPVEIQLEVDSAARTWRRAAVQTPGFGIGVPMGWLAEVPEYCVGREGQTVAVPPGDTRRWLTNGTCECPTAEQAGQLPAPRHSGPPTSQDCRLVDVDLDGQPGFTVSVDGFFTNDVYNSTVSWIIWEGEVDEGGFHTGRATEPNPVQRSVLGCLTSNTVCDPPAIDCGCGKIFNYVQFAPVGPDVECADFYNGEAVDQTGINNRFGGFGTCADNDDCPEGAFCRANACQPVTSPGSCSGCNNCCPSGMECHRDDACWPVRNRCPPNSGAVIGGLCDE